MSGPAESTRAIFSFVLDDGPRFAYQGWHLARSLVQHCGGYPTLVHVQCTPEVSERTRDFFRAAGYTVHAMDRFGDGRFCNKINQLANLCDADFDCAVLLDTDTIAVGDLRPYLSKQAITGVAVGMANPSLATLEEIAKAAAIPELPPICLTGISAEPTYLGNCNGGFYSVPKAYCALVSEQWRYWAQWLLDNAEPLSRAGKTNNVDQVSFWLTLLSERLPFTPAPSNANYQINVTGRRPHFDQERGIALLHYHHLLNKAGLLETAYEPSPQESCAIRKANLQIIEGFDNRLFWEFRYRVSPELGSGVGSRDDNLDYKRRLLISQGVRQAATVLDVGCGDLEVVKELPIRNYVGIDQSERALEIARRARPDWEFHLTPAADVSPAEMVLCFEVLIHQETREAYQTLIDFLTTKAQKTLLVSGFPADSSDIQSNPILFFYEPLEESLRRTGRLREITQVGSHSKVAIYRCTAS